MIKLIVTDLDGTLLHDDKSVPERLPRLVDELNARGITFAFASGRAVSSLREKFPGLMEKTAGIGSNGCVLAVRDQIVHTNLLKKEDTRRILDVAAQSDCIEALLVGEEYDYYTTDDPYLLDLIGRYCNTGVQVKNLDEIIETTPIIKVSLMDKKDPVAHGMEAMKPITDKFILIPSGDEWLDTVPIGEDKGACLQRLQQYLGVTQEETMCFGDYHNDAGLMKYCKYSYAMKNAHPALKALCNYETKWTNEEEGVIETICEVVGITL